MALRSEGPILRDEHGRQRVLHGMNLVEKGGPDTAVPGFRGTWTRHDLQQLVDCGLNSVRLGAIWAAIEPAPGEYSREHLTWLGEQLDLMHELGLAVVLDGHQDLYSQLYSDGAPAWATLTAHEFTPTALWSDAYLESPAVHEAYDAFWADAPGPGGVGIRTRFVRMWGMLAERFGAHPAVIGYDVLNEPTPGALAPRVFEGIVAAFAEAVDRQPDALAAEFFDPEGRLGLLDHLEDVTLHRELGDRLAPVLAAFESETVGAMYAQVIPEIRRHDSDGIILREHNYFGNIGVPASFDAPPDRNWAYAPHGYDLVVDSPAMPLASDTRIRTIFERAAETASRLDAPVMVGEWGAFGRHHGITDHADLQLDLFDEFGWSWFYWCWEADFTATEIAPRLRRPRPVAIAGDHARWGRDEGAWQLRWTGRALEAPTVLWIPPEREVALEIDGMSAEVSREAGLVRIPAGVGEHVVVVP